MTIQRSTIGSVVTAVASVLMATAATAGPITLFSTGNPDGLIATASRPANGGQIETETADDFVLGQDALISGATFTGLLPSGAALDTIQNIAVELYHVFPLDSNPPSGNVPTRTNSPSDNDFAAYSLESGITAATVSILTSTFTAANSVVNGINKFPNQTTGGEGPVTGEEVLFTVIFTTPFFVGATDHDFFRPEVDLTTGSFLWLSAPNPIVSPGTPFSSDLQAWIRNTNLDPDWLRIGTDIVGGNPAPKYNMAFSLTGTAVPEPSSALLLGMGLAALAWRRVRSS